MTDDDLLPNGMRLGQRVRLFSAAGRRYGTLAAGKVVGWQEDPTVVLQGDDGPPRHVSSRLEWEPLNDRDLSGEQAQAALKAVFDVLDGWATARLVGGNQQLVDASYAIRSAIAGAAQGAQP